MNQLRIGTRDNQTEFRPGDEVQGAAGWQLEQPAKAVEIRLFWYTRGKGTEDIGLVGTVRFEQPKQEEARPFQFQLPASPYSFSGKLISLIWALELVVEPGPHSARLELTVSSTGQEVRLHQA
jgi:hypothetical protein